MVLKLIPYFYFERIFYWNLTEIDFHSYLAKNIIDPNGTNNTASGIIFYKNFPRLRMDMVRGGYHILS